MRVKCLQVDRPSFSLFTTIHLQTLHPHFPCLQRSTCRHFTLIFLVYKRSTCRHFTLIFLVYNDPLADTSPSFSLFTTIHLQTLHPHFPCLQRSTCRHFTLIFLVYNDPLADTSPSFSLFTTIHLQTLLVNKENEGEVSASGSL